jgi:hypothetical protein
LKRLGRHLDNQFVWQIASSEARIIVDGKNVHGGLEQVS